VSGVRHDGDQKRDDFDTEMFGHRDQVAKVWCQATGEIIKIRRFSPRSDARVPLGAPISLPRSAARLRRAFSID
jgi:hypothetical protein